MIVEDLHAWMHQDPMLVSQHWMVMNNTWYKGGGALSFLIVPSNQLYGKQLTKLMKLGLTTYKLQALWPLTNIDTYHAVRQGRNVLIVGVYPQ